MHILQTMTVISEFFSTGTDLVIPTIDIKFQPNPLYSVATRQRQSLANQRPLFFCKIPQIIVPVLYGFVYFDCGLFCQVQFFTISALSLVPSW